MKTEGLTYAEAIKAYVAGERVQDKEGDEFWIEDGQPRNSAGYFAIAFPICNHFSIVNTRVKPEPESLSFEEAVKLKKVRVTPPNGHGHYLVECVFWNYPAIKIACELGWPIKAVE